MWSRLYRDHVIMAFPSFDTARNGWAPQAHISWCVGPRREFKFVRFPNRFATEGEAVACSLSRGQAWIDNRLKRLSSRAGSEEHHMIEVIDTLKENIQAVTAKQSRLSQTATKPQKEKTLTFDEFKRAIARSGPKLSEEWLRQSYGALVTLQENKHWSWAETRLKVEHSQQGPRADPRPSRHPLGGRIPLTQRDWRRIG